MEDRLVKGFTERDRLVLVYSGPRIFIGVLEGKLEVSETSLSQAGEFVCNRNLLPNGQMEMRVLVVGLAANKGPVKLLDCIVSSAILFVNDESLGAGACKIVTSAYAQFLKNSIEDKLEGRIVIPKRAPLPKGAISRS